jgi:two-component sensor histidine kinase
MVGDGNELAARQLHHRLKNQLAVVGAIAKLLARHSESAKELASKLEARLIALGHAQDLARTGSAAPLSAQEGVQGLLQAGGVDERIQVEVLPAATLAHESVQQLAVMLGELRDNALRHGALREDSGRVVISGREAEGILTLRWEEHLGAPAGPPGPEKGGLSLLRRLGAAGGLKPVIEWTQAGFAAEIHVRAKGSQTG